MKRNLTKSMRVFTAAMCICILTSCGKKETADKDRISETAIVQEINEESTKSETASENEIMEELPEEVIAPSKQEVEDARR